MKIFQLKITGFRNLAAFELQPHPFFNVLCGPNGGGKTSLLESIYLLGFGRSFRCTALNTLIAYQASGWSSFFEIIDSDLIQSSLGLQKTRVSSLKIKINQGAAKVSEMAKLFPIQLFCTDSFSLLTGGPQKRRQFLDWGLFHVEPDFLGCWQKYTRALAQRNKLLKNKSCTALELAAWDVDFLGSGARLDQYRQAYMQCFIGKLQAILSVIFPALFGEKIDFSYAQGWAQAKTLTQALNDSKHLESSRGYTQVGPHKADFVCLINGLPVAQILSRGQQKLLVCACMLARGALLLEKTGKQCIYLIDDLAAELDRSARMRIIEYLTLGQAQVFISGIDSAYLIEEFKHVDHKMFHVEHGVM